jgi:Amt family ammonium transporter
MARYPFSMCCVYDNKGMFAAVTPALAFGAIAERLRVFPFIIYVLVWSTLVYDVVVYWYS